MCTYGMQKIKIYTYSLKLREYYIELHPSAYLSGRTTYSFILYS